MKENKKIKHYQQRINLNSQDEITIFNSLCSTVLNRIHEYYLKEQYKKAKKLLRIVDKYAPPHKFPFARKGLKKFYTNLKEQL